MNDRIIQARGDGCDITPRRSRRTTHGGIDLPLVLEQIAGRGEAIRRQARATLAVTDKIPDLIEVTGDGPKIRR
jgi:hypothetical protein